MKKMLALVLALAMTLSLAACGGGSGSETNTNTPEASAPVSSEPEQSGGDQTGDAGQTGEKVMTIGLTSDITPLSCVDPTTETAAWINNIMYPTLVTAVQNDQGTLDIQWQLATDVTTEDNVHFQIHLRDDVYWSDGEKVTADDVVFAIDCFTNPEVGSTSMATFITMMMGTDSKKGYREEGSELTCATAVDENTVEIVCNSEYSLDFIITRLCYNLYALPQHILGDIPAAELLGSDEVYASKVVYGAFYVDSYISASELVLAANESYYKGAPKLDNIRFVFLTSAQITSQLASGEIDMAWPGTIDTADYEYVKGLENIETSVGAPNALVALFINNEKIPDANVRNAISLAIDRSMLVENVLGGYGEISNVPLSSTSAYLCQDYATPTYDVEAAKALLAESDFDLSQTLYLSIGAGKQTAKNNALLIEAQLEAIGFNIEIKEVENAVLDCIMGQYDITFITQTEQPLTPSHTLGIILYNNSWCKYSNPEADALYDSLSTNISAEQMMENIYALQEIVVTDYPVVPLYNATSLLAKNACVTYGGPASYGMLADIELWDVAR